MVREGEKEKIEATARQAEVQSVQQGCQRWRGAEHVNEKRGVELTGVNPPGIHAPFAERWFRKKNGMVATGWWNHGGAHPVVGL